MKSGMFYRLISKLYFTGSYFYTGCLKRLLKDRSFFPLKTSFLLTYACNCHCYMCIHEGDHCTGSLSFDDAKNVIDQIPRGSVIVITGGEPVLVKDFLKIIQYAAKAHRVQILTNGTLWDVDLIRAIVDAGVWGVSFSIDAPVASMHDRIRARLGTFQNCCDAIQEINRIKKERKRLKPLVQVNTVILKETLPYLADMVSLCKELEVGSLSMMPLRKKPDIDVYDQQDLDFLRFNLGRAMRTAQELGIHLRFANNLTCDDVERIYASRGRKMQTSIDTEGMHCCSFWTDLSVGPDGGAWICRQTYLGNIRQQRIRDLWNGPIAREQRKLFLSMRKLPEDCATCCYAFRF